MLKLEPPCWIFICVCEIEGLQLLIFIVPHSYFLISNQDIILITFFSLHIGLFLGTRFQHMYAFYIFLF